MEGGESREQAAERLRQKGNTAFATKRTAEALDFYGQSLRQFEEYRTFANRAAVHLHIGRKARQKASAIREGFHPSGRVPLPDDHPLRPDWEKYTKRLEKAFHEVIVDAGRATKLAPDFPKVHGR
jgi:hypothetical protein